MPPPTSRQPMLLIFGSFVVRMVVAVGAMVWIARIHWQLFLAAMAGFVLLRVVVTRRIHPTNAANEGKDDDNEENRTKQS